MSPTCHVEYYMSFPCFFHVTYPGDHSTAVKRDFILFYISIILHCVDVPVYFTSPLLDMSYFQYFSLENNATKTL